jgi:hypothetical protein
MADPRRAIPKTESADPSRAKLRRLQLLPMCAKSKHEIELPIRAIPYTDMLDPKRPNVLTDKELPI